MAAILANSIGWRVSAVIICALWLCLIGAKPLSAQATSEIDQAIGEFREHYSQRRYEEAVTAGQRALRLGEAMFGSEHAFVGTQSHNLALALLRSGHPQDAIVLLERALSIYANTRTPSDEVTKAAIRELADLYVLNNRGSDATKLYSATIEKLHEKGEAGGLDEAYYLHEFGQHMRRIAFYEEAEDLLRRALSIRERLLAPNDSSIATTLNSLAGILRVVGKYGEAETTYQRVIALHEKTKGPNDPNVGILLDNLGVLYLQLGRYGDAESVQKRALAILEERFGPEHVDVGQVVANMAEALRQQDRLGEAERLFGRALVIFSKTVAVTDYRIGFTLDNLAGLYREQGRQELAKATYERALATLLAAYPANHPEVGTALNNLALTHLNMGKPAEAQSLLERALKIAIETYGESHREVAVGLGNLGEAQQALGRLDAAKESFGRSIAALERSLGPEHVMLVWPLIRLADVELAQGRADVALELYRRAARLQVAARGRDQDGRTYDPRGRTSRTDAFTGLIDVAWHLNQHGGTEGTVSETFEMAQWATLSSAGAALAQLGARLGAANPALSALARERQDLVREWGAADKRLTQAVSVPPELRNTEVETSLRRRLAAIDVRLAEIDRRLGMDFPNYAALASPRPLSIEETKALLTPSEAIVHYIVDRENVYAWFVTRESASWRRLDITATDLAHKVQTLRCGLDDGEWVGVTRPGRCLDLVHAVPIDGVLPFKTSIAGELYRALLGPFEAESQGRHLLIVASGPLTSLPFHVLVTVPTDGREVSANNLAKIKWLILRNALSVLPTVPSLKAIRRDARQSTATKPYLGIGNPLLVGAAGDDRRAFAIERCTDQIALKAVAVAKPASGAAATYFRGGMADLDRLSHLEPLPETANELCSVARGLGADEVDVVLGSRASETTIRALNATGALAHYRVIHFATHGLVSGELKSLAEPALVLSPPTTVTPTDDGLLTASKVAELKLDADWVILSACNTAAAETLGAEALSGLVRAFFFAGARSLLVSHWPVRSLAAVRLTTGAINEMRANAGLGRAEALRRSMIALLQDASNEAYAHPAVWAPFVVVGEGGDNLASASTTSAYVTAREAASPVASGAEVLPRSRPNHRSSRPATSERRSKRPTAPKPTQSKNGNWLSNIFGQF
jgi:CHAT domain-containing protein/tetratricopeptide (TPR) repeat protein